MHSVFHHFPDPGMAVRRIKDLLAPGGSFITFDPIVTNALFRTARGLYRPFQSDREWEWPLRHAAFEVLGQELELCRVQGYLGMEMYAAVLYTMLPLKPMAALKERRAGNRCRGCRRDRPRPLPLQPGRDVVAKAGLRASRSSLPGRPNGAERIEAATIIGVASEKSSSQLSGRFLILGH